MGYLMSDFELIGVFAMAETSCLSSSELRSLFTKHGLLIFLLFIHHLAKEPLLALVVGRLHKRVGHLHFFTLEVPYSGSQDLVIFITSKVDVY